MRTIAITLLLLSFARFVSGQDAASPDPTESHFLWAHMTQAGGPDNWVRVDLRPNVLRDAAGAIESGGITWRLRWNVASQMQVGSLRIDRKGGSGADREAFRLNFSPPLQMQGLAAAGGTVDTMGTTIAVRAGDRDALEAFRRLLNHPSEHTVTLDVQGQPEGVFRAPLWRTEPVVMMSLMNPGSSPTAALWAYAFLARNASNRVVYGELLFSGSYRFPAQVTVSGLQIRSENGQGLSLAADFTPFLSAASGSGNLPGLYARILPENEIAFQAFLNLVENPGRFTMQLETSGLEPATLRGRVRKTDRMRFPIYLDARNVVPPPANWQDRWVGTQTFHTVRNEDGTIAAAVLAWEANMC